MEIKERVNSNFNRFINATGSRTIRRIESRIEGSIKDLYHTAYFSGQEEGQEAKESGLNDDIHIDVKDALKEVLPYNFDAYSAFNQIDTILNNILSDAYEIGFAYGYESTEEYEDDEEDEY